MNARKNAVQAVEREAGHVASMRSGRERPEKPFTEAVGKGAGIALQ